MLINLFYEKLTNFFSLYYLKYITIFVTVNVATQYNKASIGVSMVNGGYKSSTTGTKIPLANIDLNLFKSATTFYHGVHYDNTTTAMNLYLDNFPSTNSLTRQSVHYRSSPIFFA